MTRQRPDYEHNERLAMQTMQGICTAFIRYGAHDGECQIEDQSRPETCTCGLTEWLTTTIGVNAAIGELLAEDAVLEVKERGH